MEPAHPLHSLQMEGGGIREGWVDEGVMDGWIEGGRDDRWREGEMIEE